MRSLTLALLLSGAAFGGPLLIGACADEQTPQTTRVLAPVLPPGNAPGSRDGGSIPAFAESPCHSCLARECAAPINTCKQQPGCASRWECIERCPVSADGAAEPACRDACPNPSGTQEQSAA